MKKERENKVKTVFSNQKDLEIDGAGNSSLAEEVPNYNSATSEKVLEGKNNTFIVFGRDRPGDKNSGYGGLGVKGCGAIDIVAGRVSVKPTEVNDEGLEQVVNPSIPYDAARITISQWTDGDKNHYLASNKLTPRTSSFVTIKADNVRVVSRENIRLIAGIDKHISNGKTKVEKYGIDLIGDNDDSDMQSLVKGQNLSELLSSMIDKIAKNGSEIATIMNILMRLETQLAVHTHLIPTPTPLLSAPAVNLVAEAATTATELIGHLIDSQTEQINLASMKIKYLKPFGKRYINSKRNKTN